MTTATGLAPLRAASRSASGWLRGVWPGVLFLACLALIVAAAGFGPMLWHADPEQTNLFGKYGGLEPGHPLGTDQFGRDILSRLLYGARLSLFGASVVLVGSSGLGLLVAALAGTIGGRLDSFVSRILDALLALPSLVVALGMVGVLGRSFSNLLLALVITGWPWYARSFRGMIITERAKDYVLAATAIGSGPVRIAFVHIARNVAGPLLVVATVSFGNALLALASLSFLGLGAQPPTPEWGAMVSDSRFYFETHPWLIVAPGVSIALSVLMVNLLGDALRDLADPRLRVRSQQEQEP